MFEKRFGRVLAGWFLFVGVMIALHWWQDAMGETDAYVWSCHTMGNHRCGPGQPWLTFPRGQR